jgi:hypothetical protein
VHYELPCVCVCVCVCACVRVCARARCVSGMRRGSDLPVGLPIRFSAAGNAALADSISEAQCLTRRTRRLIFADELRGEGAGDIQTSEYSMWQSVRKKRLSTRDSPYGRGVAYMWCMRPRVYCRSALYGREIASPVVNVRSVETWAVFVFLIGCRSGQLL